MLTNDFNYNLPQESIANFPVNPRDHSKMMVINANKKSIENSKFFDLPSFLKKGDLLVWNNSKVFKARLHGVVVVNDTATRVEDDNSTGVVINANPVEIFLVRPMENKGVWKILAKPAKRLRLGMRLQFAEDFFCNIILKEKDGSILVQFDEDDVEVRIKANKYGEVPIPPYIKNEQLTDEQLYTEYQTVYAKKEGAVAAPTAGLHFTPKLIEKLKDMGVEFAEVTLHVGLGTFQPVKTEKLEDHKMHSEWVEITDANVKIINKAKDEGRRVVAVGTTTVRTLEAVAAIDTEDNLEAFTGDVNIFITPGFEFKIVDAIITNFHLPKSTLIMMISAFVADNMVVEDIDDGRKFLLSCYEEAVKKDYRFYSFGDAMFVS